MDCSTVFVRVRFTGVSPIHSQPRSVEMHDPEAAPAVWSRSKPAPCDPRVPSAGLRKPATATASSRGVPHRQSTARRTVANIPLGLGGSRGLSLALLDVGQLLYPIRLRTLAFRFAALRLGILDLGLGRRAGLLLCCPDPGLRPALGLFDRLHTLGGHFVGLLLGRCGALLGGVDCRTLALLGFRSSVLDATLLGFMGLLPILDRLVPLGLQLGIGVRFLL